MNVKIRPAGPGDVPAIAAIYGDAVLNGAATFELEPPDEAEMARRRTALLDAGYPYLVAEGAGRILGYAYAGAFRTRPGYRHTVEDSIYVAPDAHRQGIGGELLGALIGECERRSFRQMIAVVSDPGNGGSLRLHAAHGFTLVGTYAGTGWKFGRWIDTAHLQRALGPGSSTPPGA
jgi:phosphinothricin acetyltransferase